MSTPAKNVGDVGLVEFEHVPDDAYSPYLRSPSVHVEDSIDGSLDEATLSDDEAASLDDVADGDDADAGDGMVWHAQIVADDYNDPKHCTDGVLKARRPIPQVRASEFFGLLEQRGGRWMYAGPPLNGDSGVGALPRRASRSSSSVER